MCALCPAQHHVRLFSQAFETVCLSIREGRCAVAISNSGRDSDSTINPSQQSPRRKRVTLERSFWDANPETSQQQGQALGNNVPPDSPHVTGPGPTSVWPNGLSASFTNDYASARDATEVHGVDLPLSYLDPVLHPRQQTFSGSMAIDSRQNAPPPIFAGGVSNGLSANPNARSVEGLVPGSPLPGTAVAQRHTPRASTNVVDRLEPRLGLDDSRPPSRDRPPHLTFGGGSGSVPVEKMTLASISSRRPSAAISTSGPLASASGMLSPVDLGYLSPLDAKWLFDQ